MKYRFAILFLVLGTAVAYAQASGSEKTFTGAQSAAVKGNATSGVPAAARAGISAALGRDDSSYAISRQAGRMTASTPDHKLSAEFQRDGVHVRAGKADMGLALLSYGYGDAMRNASKAVPQASQNRVEYKRGGLTEWYENGPLGVEQGFTLAQAPVHKRVGPLTIAMALSGDLTATADADGSEVMLKDHNQQASLVYGGLTSYDANGKELRTWMEVHGKQVQLKVDDAAAVYPVVVDPWVQVARLTASDATAYDFMGNAVSVNEAGLVVAVGAAQKTVGGNSQQGSVYLFVRPAKGWATTKVFQAEFTSSDGEPGDNFGASVALSADGKTIVIGAPQATINGNAYQGAVYVYVRPTSGWKTTNQFTAKLTASNGAAYDWLGSSVAFDNVSVVAGAYGHAVNTNPYQGEAYVYTKPTTGWTNATETAQLTSSDGQAWDLFGYSVSAYNGVAAVGAAQATVNGQISQGAAYVFVAPSTGWVSATQNAKLVASNGISEDLFGTSIAISPDTTTVAVGAEAADVNGNGGQGAVYVFLKPTGGWAGEPLSQTAELTASDGLQEDYFGAAVAINFKATTIAVGAPFAPYFNNGKYIGPGPGKVYTYVKPQTGWANTSTYSQKLVVSGGKNGAEYGSSVGTNTNTLAAGAIGATINNQTNQGAAFIAGVK